MSRNSAELPIFPSGIATEELRPLERLLLALLHQVGELLRADVFHSSAREFSGPLERRAVLVLVRVVALQVGIAPGRSGLRSRTALAPCATLAESSKGQSAKFESKLKYARVANEPERTSNLLPDFEL